MEQIKNMKVLEQLGNNCYRILIQNQQAQLDVISKRMVLANKSYLQLRKWIEIQYHINHPNVQKLYFYCHDQEYVYVIREYMPKGSLLNWIKYGDIDEELLNSIANQLFSVQQYLNENQLYLDLQINNIFFDENNRIKISNLEDIEHKSKKINNIQQIGLILYECIFKRKCRFDYVMQNDQVIRQPRVLITQEIKDSVLKLLQEYIK
ncbi:unnamed protein product [Paramecium primaurelia]|uniref:Protein kinase domain-containing protein n=2 Tax=Paramecium TaxID=5884 RepID=A0A8S1VQK2_9CILI|nr:unnamed protein product [Paramecium primaurelia]CAD8180268.1 unnamed protein product [Paramecium pentaurelia]